MKTLEDKLSKAGRDVRQLADQIHDVRNPAPSRLGRSVAVSVGAAMLVAFVVLPVLLLGNGERTETDPAGDPRPLTSLYFAADFIPDGFEPHQALFLGGDSLDPGSEIATARTYHSVDDPNPNQFTEGEASLSIVVTDALADTEDELARFDQGQIECVDENGEPRDREECRAEIAQSSCDGTEAIAAGDVNPQACIDEQMEMARPEDATLTFTQTQIRGRPALIKIETRSDYSEVKVLVYEGNGLITGVTGHQIEDSTVVQVAEELRPITRSEFEADTPR